MKRKKKRPLTTCQAGRLGGKARAKKLSKKQRSESARKAVIARWKKAKGADYRPPP